MNCQCFQQERIKFFLHQTGKIRDNSCNSRRREACTRMPDVIVTKIKCAHAVINSSAIVHSGIPTIKNKLRFDDTGRTRSYTSKWRRHIFFRVVIPLLGLRYGSNSDRSYGICRFTDPLFWQSLFKAPAVSGGFDNQDVVLILYVVQCHAKLRKAVEFTLIVFTQGHVPNLYLLIALDSFPHIFHKIFGIDCLARIDQGAEQFYAICTAYISTVKII